MAEVFAVAEDDYADLAAFLADFEDSSETADFWQNKFRFWWDDNPACTVNAPRGWALRQGDTIGGFIGNVPTKFRLNGKEVPAYNSTTWRVLPHFREQSLRLLSELIVAARETILFVTTASNVTARILDASRFNVIARGCGSSATSASVILINVPKGVSAKLGNGMLARAAARPLAALAKAVQAVRLKGLSIAGNHVVREIDRADAGFDQLWARTCGLYANTNVRSAEAINWLCFGDVSNAKKLFGCYNSKDELLAYMVLWPRFRTTALATVLECIDLWGGPGEDRAVQSLVGFSRAYAREHGSDLVMFGHFTTSLAESFAKMKLLKLAVPARKEYFQVSSGVQFDEENSYLVSGQGDYAF